MWFRIYVVRPLRRFWQGLKPLLLALDRHFVALATLFGVTIRDPAWRYGTLLGIYAVIYALAFVPVPWLALLALFVGYVGILAVGRAWVANEKLRTEIVKKLSNADPDALPDLRGAALVSALQLIVLFPLLFWRLQKSFGLFTGAEEANFWTWLAFTFESVAKLFAGWTGGSVALAREIGFASPWGRHLVLLKNLTIDWILIQGILRLFAIATTIKEGVTALRQDPDITRRLGRRAVEPLIDKLHDPDRKLREQAAAVLGDLKDERSVDALIETLGDPESDVRWRAAEALGALGDARACGPLIERLRDADPAIRSGAVHALEKLGSLCDPAPLIALLTGDEAGPIRAAAADALGYLKGVDAIDPLSAALKGRDEDVARAAAEALGRAGGGRSVEPLTEALRDRSLASRVRGEAARALGALHDRRAAPMLGEALADDDLFVRKSAAHALGTLGDTEAAPALLTALSDSVAEVREAAAEALGRLKDSRAVVPLVELLRDDNESVAGAAAQALESIRGKEAVEPLLRVLGEGAPLAQRLAADLLGKLGDARAAGPLAQALTSDDRGVRESAAWALGEVGDGSAFGSLAQALLDPDAAVRQRAGEAIDRLSQRLDTARGG